MRSMRPPMDASLPGSSRLVGRPSGRAVWVLLAVLAAAAFVAAGANADNALRREESAARARAERYTNTVLFRAMTEEMIGQPILGPFYRSLLIDVQAGIMTDEGVAGVRIFSPEGVLLFSTGERDRIGERMTGVQEQVATAAEGRTGTLVAEATVAPRATLRGEVERVHQTFVPLRIQGRAAVVGVAEIDQRYAGLEAAASAFWRPVRTASGIAFVLFALLALLASRAVPWPRTRPAADGREKEESSEAPGATTAAVPDRVSPEPDDAGEELRAAAEAARSAAELHAAAEAARVAQDSAGATDDRRAAEELARAAEEELESAGQQIRQAEEAYRWLNQKARQSEDRIKDLEAQLKRFLGTLAEDQARHATALAADDLARTDILRQAMAQAEARARIAEEELRRSEEMRAMLEEQISKADAGLRAVEARLRLSDKGSPDGSAVLRGRLASARPPSDDEEPQAAG